MQSAAPTPALSSCSHLAESISHVAANSCSVVVQHSADEGDGDEEKQVSTKIAPFATRPRARCSGVCPARSSGSPVWLFVFVNCEFRSSSSCPCVASSKHQFLAPSPRSTVHAARTSPACCRAFSRQEVQGAPSPRRKTLSTILHQW